MFYCDKCRKKVVVIVSVPLLDRDGELFSSEGIQVDSDGVVTDFWYDGIRGVPDELRGLAGEESEGICINCNSLVDWRN